MKRTILYTYLLAVLAGVAPATTGASEVHPIRLGDVTPEALSVQTERAYFQVTTADDEGVEAFRRELIDRGARNVNWFYPDVVVADLRVDRDWESVRSRQGIVYRSESSLPSYVAGVTRDRLSDVRRAYQLAERRASRTAPAFDAAPFDDELRVIPPDRAERISKSVRSLPFRAERGPGEIARNVAQNSEILTGSIKVYLIFPESNGLIDSKTETWYDTDGVESQDYLDARTSAFAALLDWQGKYPKMGISYRIVDMIVDCDYEAIQHSSSSQVRDDMWIMDVLREIEPEASALQDPTAAAHVFNEKNRGGYDWIYMSFIARSRSRPDNRFQDAGYTAYAYLGGPYLVIPFPAGGDPNNVGESLVFSQIYQHEAGHIFWTLDEYPFAPGTCAATSGYLNFANQNITMIDPSGNEGRCIDLIDCIMNNAARLDIGRPFCVWSQGHMGVVDFNNNTFPDIWESPPAVEFEAAEPETVEAASVTVRLTARSTAVPNRNNTQAPEQRKSYAPTLRKAQFSIGGGFVDLGAQDGRWDETSEDCVIRLSGFPIGLTSILVKVWNDAGVESQLYRKDIYFAGINYSRVGVSVGGDRMNVVWEIIGNAFGATFDVYRLEPGQPTPDLSRYGPQDELPGTLVAEDVQPAGPGNGGFVPYRVVDRDVTPGTDYRYYVAGSFELEFDGEVKPYRSPSNIVGSTAMIPVSQGILSNAAPNPSNGSVTLSVRVPATLESQGNFNIRVETPVEVAIYDVAGRRVKELANGLSFADVLTVRWDGTNLNGDRAPSGVYFVRAKAGSAVDVQKVMLIR